MARALIIFALLLPSAAAGQPDKTRDEAARAFAEGAGHYRRAEYEKAIEAFTRSHRLHPHFLTLCNIARCYEHAGDPIKASEFYRRCLKDGGSTSPRAREITAARHKVEAQLGSITIESGGEQATVFVDGKAVGRAPATVLLKPGPHAAQLRRGPVRLQTVAFEVRAGEKRTIVVRLPRRQAATRPSASTQPAAAAPASQQEPTRRASRRRLHQAWFWTAVALTVTFGVTSAALGAKTLDANHDYEANPTREGYDRVIQRRNLTNAFFGLALGAAGASGALFFFTRFSSNRSGDDDLAAGVRRELTFSLVGHF